MDKGAIIKKWRIGFTVKQISKQYMEYSNKKRKKDYIKGSTSLCRTNILEKLERRNEK